MMPDNSEAAVCRSVGSRHQPPEAFLVESYVRSFCEFINDNWHERNAFFLSAYTMWRLNWIHPFSDGNGRTSRALSYLILCVKLGYVLPGSPTIPQQIEENRDTYFRALGLADESVTSPVSVADVSAMEDMIKSMLARQLLGVIEAAGASSAGI